MCHWLLSLELWHEINGALVWLLDSEMSSQSDMLYPLHHHFTTDMCKGHITPSCCNFVETM